MAVTFRLVGPYTHLSLPVMNFAPEDPTLLNYNNANPLEQGEFLTINANYRVARAANPGARPGPYPLFTEKGRSDTQGIAGGKVAVIVGGGYIAESKIINVAAAPALGAALEVANITWSALTKSGLQTFATGVIVGYVLRPAASNDGWLQYISMTV